MTGNKLVRNKLRLAELGFGGAPVGNLYEPVSDAAARAALDTAYDAGIRYFDTAPYYGLGLSERRVGDALRSRENIVVSTKVGRLLRPAPTVRGDSERHGFRSAMPFEPHFDYSYEGVMRSWESSLHRLGLARVEILYVHDNGGETHGDEAELFRRQLLHGGLRALHELRDSGAIDAFGLGVNEIAVCLDVMKETRLDVILLAGRYTLLEQGALDELMPACVAADTAVVIGGPYNSGILATGSGAGEHALYNYSPAPPDVLRRVARIEAVCERYGVALPAAALQFPLAHPQVVSVIPGLGNAARVLQAARFIATAAPSALWSELKAEGLLRADAPVPNGK